MNELGMILIVACVAAFGILLAKKVGIVEWLQVNGNDITPELASCDFCMSFWAGIVLWAFLAVYYHDVTMLTYAVVSCPLTRMML